MTPGKRLTEMNNRLKILFLTDWYPSEENLVSGIFIKEHVKAATLYNDVTVMVLGGGARYKKRLYDVTESTDEGIRTIRYRYKISPIPKTSYFVKIWGLLKYFRKMLRQGYRPDVIHANTIPAGIPAIILGKLHGIPVVITEHSSAIPMHVLRPLGKIEVRFAMNRADMILPVSGNLMTHIESYGIKNRFRIIPNAVNTELFYPSSAGEKREHIKRMLLVATFRPIKGVPYLLEALAKLRNKRKDFVFDIVGDGPDRAEYEATAEKLGLSDCVTFHGVKTKPEIAHFMRQCDIFVLPSIWENLPCVLIEAMASGARVIATDVGGVRELVNQEAGVLIPPRDIQRLEEAMNKMLDNYGNYSSEKIAKYAWEKFGYEAVGRLLDAAYREILVR
jgi:L-malate glycosyltransferase